MSERTWMPSHMQDEIIPPPRPTPGDWIVGPVGDRWLIAGDEDADAVGRDASRRTLAPGETLDFEWNEIGETFEAVIFADGRCELPAGGEPPQASQYWLPGDTDSMAFGWESFVSQQADWIRSSGGESELLEVQPYTWSDPVPHRLVVEDGAARFEPVEPEAADHG